MKRVILIFISLLFLSCNLINEQTNVTNIAIRASLNDSSRSISDSIKTMSLEVTADDINKIIEISENNKIAVSVPTGEDRTFLLNIEFDDGELVTGSKTLDIEGSYQEIDIVLNSLIESFAIKKVNNSSLISDIKGTIVGNTIYLGLPKSLLAGTEFNKTNLVPTVSHNGTNGTFSGNDFTIPVTYDVEDINGNITTFNIEVFDTFKNLKADNISLGSAPTDPTSTTSEMEPGIDIVDGLVYLSYADSSNRAILKTYDPKTGILSENIFNYPGAPTSPRFFKVHGESKDDLYFAYQAEKTLTIYHFNGTSWTKKLTHLTGYPDLSFATYKNYIYIGEVTSSGEYILNRFDTLNPTSLEEIFLSITVWGTCITNSLAVENENSIYITTRVFNNPYNYLTAYYYDGINTIKNVGNTIQVNPYSESIFSGSIGPEGVLLDYSDPDFNSITASAPRGSLSNLIYPLSPSAAAIELFNTRSFYDNTYYRVVYDNPVRLMKFGSTAWESTPIWTTSTSSNTNDIKKPKILANENDLYSTFVDSSSMEFYFFHGSK